MITSSFMLRHECGVKPKRAAKMRVADSVNRSDMVRSCSVLVSRGQTLFRAGRYRLQHKRLRSVAYTASDNALRGRGVWLYARLVLLWVVLTEIATKDTRAKGITKVPMMCDSIWITWVTFWWVNCKLVSSAN